MRQASLEAAAKANAAKAQKIASYGIKQTPSTLVPGSEPSDKNNSESLKKLENSTPGDSLPRRGFMEAEEAKEPVKEEKPKSGRSSVTFKGGDNKDKSKELIMPTAPEEPMMKHRGSSVSMATPEEIKAVEEASKITEEPEEEAVAEVGESKSKMGKETTGDANKGETGGGKTEEVGGKKGEVVGSKKEVGKETTGDASKTEVGGAKTEVREITGDTSKGDVEGVKTEDATATTGEEEKLPGTKTQDQEAASAEKAGESVAD